MAEYPESFADYLQSVAHVISERDGDASKWSPRDVLIAALRKLDKGEINPDILVVTWRHRHDDKNASTTEWLVASTDRCLTLGHLQHTLWALSN